MKARGFWRPDSKTRAALKAGSAKQRVGAAKLDKKHAETSPFHFSRNRIDPDKVRLPKYIRSHMRSISQE